VAGWGLGLIVALLWMFLLGLFLGKGLTPGSINFGEIKKRMMAEHIWPGSGASKEQPSETTQHATSTKGKIPVEELEFYEALARKKERAKVKSPASHTAKRSRPATVTASKQTARAGSSTSSEGGRQTAAAGRYTVQVAAFKDEESARKFASTLKGLPARPTIRTANIPGKGRWYRVQVGDLTSRSAAQTLAQRLAREHQLKPLVIKLER